MRITYLFLAATLGCGAPKTIPVIQPEIPVLKYPSAKYENVVDNYHGTDIEDPYRWLEDPDSEATRAWVTAQNEMSSAWLSNIPHREHIQTRLEQLWQNERYGVPRKRAGKYCYSYNDGQSNQPTLYQTEDWTKDGHAILDVNSLSDDGTVSLSSYQISKNGKYMAYGLSDGGSDWVTIRVRDLTTGEDLADTTKWVKFSSPTWLPDSSGFFYSRYPEPTENQENALRFQKVFFIALEPSNPKTSSFMRTLKTRNGVLAFTSPMMRST